MLDSDEKTRGFCQERFDCVSKIRSNYFKVSCPGKGY